MEEQSSALAFLPMLIVLAITVVVIAGMWKVFTKAGQPGWAVLIPIYNAYILLKVAGRPGWWLILLLIPIVSIVVAVVVAIDVAKNFGRGVLYGLGLAFLSPIFYPMLGFGSDQYVGKSSQ